MEFTPFYSSSSGLWMFDWIFQKAPRMHPGGIQQPRGNNSYHPQLESKSCMKMLILLCVLKVRLGFIGIYYPKCLLAGDDVPRHTSRPLDTTPLEPLQLNTVWGNRYSPENVEIQMHGGRVRGQTACEIPTQTDCPGDGGHLGTRMHLLFEFGAGLSADPAIF